MGQLAHSTDVRATWLERSIPWMIEDAIMARLTSLQASIDDLTSRVIDCEKRQRKASKITTSNIDVSVFMKDMDDLKSTDFTSLLEAAHDLDFLKTLDIPPTTMWDAHKHGTTNGTQRERLMRSI